MINAVSDLSRDMMDFYDSTIAEACRLISNQDNMLRDLDVALNISLEGLEGRYTDQG